MAASRSTVVASTRGKEAGKLFAGLIAKAHGSYQE